MSRQNRSKCMNVRCLIDETTSHSFVLRPVAEELGFDEESKITEEERRCLYLELGPVFIPGNILIGVTDISLDIDHRSHIFSTWVVEELFPSHPEVDIQIVLGREFLRAFPGLVMKPMYRGIDELDLIPWSIAGGQDIIMNGDGEMLIYVYGHSELQAIDEKRGIKKEQGSFGVFFGPNSNNNMFRKSTFQGKPMDVFALVEGIMYAVKASIHGRWVEGSYTYTSVRIYINSEEIFNVIGSKETLKNHREAGWKDENGKVIQYGAAIRIWDEWSNNQPQYTDNNWTEEEVIKFAATGRENRWMEAAYILATSGIQSSSEVKELRKVEENPGNKWEDHFFTFIDLFPSDDNGRNDEYKLFCYRKKDFIDAQDAASMAASDPSTRLNPSELVKIDIHGFYPSMGIVGIFTFWRSLEKRKRRTAAQVFAVSNLDFIEKVIKIAKENGRLMDNVEWNVNIMGVSSVDEENIEDINSSLSCSSSGDDSAIDM
ncbi:uncharacterized protein H6S33_010002 [Morchella sextelata]|uniref:uncharacterized protein n=1 Tax=Morchella sextelata TaxID=1174677 RepID=UPI001D04F756|nr:uncharacterized protein H6S33_010002 [Morchella sextelata]KAH0611950.1 hypothetical protein H6S33_010002 [Morchella sextelata]